MFKILSKNVKISLILALAMSLVHLPLNTVFNVPELTDEDPAAHKKEQEWVDGIYNNMTEDERIGQLFMVRAHSDKGLEHEQSIERLIKDYHLGGLCFFQGTPEKQVELINKFQSKSKKVPIMIAMDAEWGLGMRFKSDGLSYPKQLMLGAIQDNHLIYEMGREVARELKRVGTHINFAPVVDVNNNPNNPVINDRSFGEDRYNVTTKSYMYMKGMQDHNVMACAKHFPGHGDTDVDSHYDLPQILHSRERLDSIEMFPFQVLSQHGIQSMMVAHLFIPSIDNTANRPTTLSKKAVTDILKNELNYKGLIFTDGLGMQGVTKHHSPGELEVKALLAGNDVLLLPSNTPAAYKAIKTALGSGKLPQSILEAAVKKILKAKYKLGLTSFTPLKKQGVRSDVTGPRSKAMKRKLIANALTLVRNKDNTIPFQNLSQKRIASLSIGSASQTEFQNYIDKYGNIKHYKTDKNVSNSSSLLSILKKYDEVIVSFHGMSSSAKKKFGVSSSAVNFIAQLQNEANISLVIFGNPYSLKYFDSVETVLACYNSDKMTQQVAAQAIFGALPIKGKLPITASDKSAFGMGVQTQSLMKLQYDIPESAGLNSYILNSIDTIAQEAMDKKATPGLQVLVAKSGKVVFHKSYGHHTYKKAKKVKNSDIYDLASLTKIASSTLSLMKLYDEGKVNIDQPISNHLNGTLGTNKANLKIRDIIAHHAGLKAWIPFYKETITKSKKPSTKYYKKTAQGKYTVPVTDKLYMDQNYVSEVWNQIYTSELRSTTNYKYSDIGFYMMAKLIEENTGKSLDQYTYDSFYAPLGLNRTCYKPLERHGKEEIIPTELDKYFRRQTVHGHVHDMGAAMLGGVSGHAGLFSTADDLAVLFQMILNGGYYGGKQFIQPNTIRTFTQRYHKSTRRGLGFDMKESNPDKSQNVCANASLNTYGHTGFTGTAVWVDPDHDLIYIFLSNRTYPNMNNFKLNKLDIRPRIQQVIYDSMY